VVVTKNVTNLYAEPNTDSEIVTQNLMGQTASVLERKDGWVYVEGWDTYPGWIRSIHVRDTADGEPAYASSGEVAVVAALFAEVYSEPDKESTILTKATVSTELEVTDELLGWFELGLPDGRNGFIQITDVQVEMRAQEDLPMQPEGCELVQTAKRLIGVPYFWGGVSPFGIDCSGFMQLIYKVHGAALLRDAHMQAADPRAYPVERDDLQPGDLIFFARRIQEGDPRITHVGMSMGGDDFIHSGGMGGVYISSLVKDASYGPTYWGARRMDFIGEAPLATGKETGFPHSC
jgi:hypothetical protein